MGAGELDRRVSFDEPSPGSDGQGGQEDGWAADRHSCWAGFRYLRGGETVIQARLAGTQVIVAKIRKNASAKAITNGWRMRDTREGVAYNVRSIIPSDDRAFYEITCESGVAI